jgi:hypothetical protein
MVQKLMLMRAITSIVKYFEWFANHYSDTNFVMVIPDGTATKKIDAQNVTGMSLSVFNKNLYD